MFLVFLQSLLWDLKSTKERRARKGLLEADISAKDQENFLMLLNLENLYKDPTSFIEKE